MEHLKVVTCYHWPSGVCHLYFQKVFDEIVNAVVGFMIFQFFLQVFEVEIDFFEVAKLTWVFHLFLDLHESILFIFWDVLGCDGWSVLVKFYHHTLRIFCWCILRKLKNHSQQRNRNPLMLNHLPVDSCFNSYLTFKVISGTEILPSWIVFQVNVAAGVARHASVQFIE